MCVLVYFMSVFLLIQETKQQPFSRKPQREGAHLVIYLFLGGAIAKLTPIMGPSRGGSPPLTCSRSRKYCCGEDCPSWNPNGEAFLVFPSMLTLEGGGFMIFFLIDVGWWFAGAAPHTSSLRVMGCGMATP